MSKAWYALEAYSFLNNNAQFPKKRKGSKAYDDALDKVRTCLFDLSRGKGSTVSWHEATAAFATINPNLTDIYMTSIITGCIASILDPDIELWEAVVGEPPEPSSSGELDRPHGTGSSSRAPQKKPKSSQPAPKQVEEEEGSDKSSVGSAVAVETRLHERVVDNFRTHPTAKTIDNLNTRLEKGPSPSIEPDQTGRLTLLQLRSRR